MGASIDSLELTGKTEKPLMATMNKKGHMAYLRLLDQLSLIIM